MCISHLFITKQRRLKETPRFLPLMPLEQARNQTVNCRAANPRPQAKLKKKRILVFCWRDYIKRFTRFILQPKSPTEIG